MYFPCKEWEEDPNHFIYLGSEKNPRTGQEYDYWLYDRGDGKAPYRYSPTARHGPEPPDYGSGPLCIARYDRTHIDSTKDWCFGIERSQQLAMYYLATGERPLVEEIQ